MWNSQEHMEAYLAIPSMGAVLHTLNIRLFPEQLAYVINHGEDRVVLVDDSLVPLLAKVAAELTTVECFVVVGDGDASALGSDRPVLRYSELLAAESPEFAWPEIDERQAAAMCYTSGTTGNPKGVAYSHRSAFLHSFAADRQRARTCRERDRILMIVPMFHANAWGIPYAAFLCGASLVMPGKFLQAEPLTRMVKEERVTFSGAVPDDLGRHLPLRRAARDRPVEHPHDHLRRLRGAALADGELREASTACASSRRGA